MKKPRGRQTEAEERMPIRHRWRAQPPGDSDEARAGTLLRSAAAVQPFGARNLAEVAARLRSRERHLSRKWAWQIAIAVGLLLFGGAVSAAVMHFLRVASVGPALPDTPVSMPTSKTVRRRHMLVAQPFVPAVLPAPEAPPVPGSTAGQSICAGAGIAIARRGDSQTQAGTQSRTSPGHAGPASRPIRCQWRA